MIGSTRRKGDNASKNKLFSQLVSIGAVLKAYAKFVIYRWLRIFDVILRVTLVILDHMQKEKWIVGIKWIQFRSWFRSFRAKVSIFIMKKFSPLFSLSFNISVHVVCFLVALLQWIFHNYNYHEFSNIYIYIYMFYISLYFIIIIYINILNYIYKILDIYYEERKKSKKSLKHK